MFEKVVLLFFFFLVFKTKMSSLSYAPSSSSLSTAAYQRNQISISSLTCNDNDNSILGHMSSSPPPSSTCSNRDNIIMRHVSSSPPLTTSTMMNKTRRYYQPYPHHPYMMSHNTSHPGTSLTMMMKSPPTSPPDEDSRYYSLPTSPSYHYNEHNSSNQLQERRQRNKVASAKYRQKKNMQQHEMRKMICQISDRNAMLERQILEVRQENQQLRATADKLRGKMVATKLLRQWMQKNSQEINVNNVQIDDDDDELLTDENIYDL